jgi:hypothetical protein
MLLPLRVATARSAYRGAWAGFLLAPNPHTRHALGEVMDALQPDCVTQQPPGHLIEFKQFGNSLPGFNGYWDAWFKASRRSLR